MKTAKLGLERIEKILAHLGNPERSFRVIHVAGTNGKGSTCAMIESGLRASGGRTGLFTSPHLIEPTERIQVDGMPVSQAQFSRAFDVVHVASETLERQGQIDAHASYFETVAAMAFWLFRDLGVESAVIEVGLGGRLDATNVVQPDLTVITQIALDHQIFLGDTIELIAAEKAGILKAGIPAVFSKQLPEAQRVLDARAQELGIAVTRASDFVILDLEMDARGCHFSGHEAATAPDSSLQSKPAPKILEVTCPLAGEHQVDNAITAALALEQLGVSTKDIAQGIKDTRWPGRLEYISPNPDILLDGAHNPAGARALAQYLQTYYPHRKRWMIFGAMGDKAVAELGAILFPLSDELILTAPDTPRALAPDELLGIAERIRSESTRPENAETGDSGRGMRPRSTPNIKAAFQLVAAEASAEDLVVVTGSLFLVGEARAASYNKNSWPFSGAWSS
jgi:dihydrofolate synthase / folylpolyglutamate synthase